MIYQIDEEDSVNFFIEYEDGTQDIRRAESVQLLDDFLDTESDSESDSIQNLDTLDEAGGGMVLKFPQFLFQNSSWLVQKFSMDAIIKEILMLLMV